MGLDIIMLCSAVGSRDPPDPPAGYGPDSYCHPRQRIGNNAMLLSVSASLFWVDLDDNYFSTDSIWE